MWFPMNLYLLVIVQNSQIQNVLFVWSLWDLKFYGNVDSRIFCRSDFIQKALFQFISPMLRSHGNAPLKAKEQQEKIVDQE